MRLLLLIFISINLLADDFINVPLNEYIAVVSRVNKINIALDENIDHKITLLVSKKLSKKTYFDVLTTLLENKGMYLDKHDNFYMIKKKIVVDKDKIDTFISPALQDQKTNKYNFDTNTTEPQYYKTIKLNFIDFKDIENFLKVYENVKYQFITSSKLLLIKASNEDFKSIEQTLKQVDLLPPQLKLKVTIMDTNLDKLKEFGIEHEFNINSSNNYFFNLVAYPYTVSSDVSSTQKDSFYTFVKMINETGNSKLVSSPILTLSDNKKTEFEVATTIPYSEGTTTIDSDTTSTTESLKYKDVGLVLSATPRIYNNELVYIDLDLEVSNVVSSTNNVPIVSKKHIKQSFYLDSKKIFVLTGINQNESIENINGIPYLMDIPFLGWLFKYESKDEKNSNLSIFFEVINNAAAKKELQLIDKYTPPIENNVTYPNYDQLEKKENERYKKRICENFGICD